MKRLCTWITVLICVAGTLGIVSQASAATTWAHEGWTKVGNWTLGGDIRVRWVRSSNMSNMGFGAFGAWNDIDIFRQRGRLWVKADLPKGVTTYFRMTQEFRWGENSRGVNLGREDRWSMLLDNAWIQFAEPYDVPITLKVGRMDLRYGQCFLICDSDSVYNPDGSRTFFFDAAKATIHLKGISTDIDVLYAKFHEADFNLSNDDEDLYGVYATSTYGKPLKAEFYLLVREQGRDRLENIVPQVGGPQVGIVHPKRHTWTWGTRLSGKWGNFSSALEFAAQTGDIDHVENFKIANSQTGFGNFEPYKNRSGNMDIMAFGGYWHGTYAFPNAPLKPAVTLGYWFYSGDDKDANAWGGFDDLYAQAPIHGEYYLYSNLDLLSSPDADWTPFMHSNLHFPKVQVSVVPYEAFKLTLIYEHMFAHKNTQPVWLTNSQGGKNRGDYLIGILGYQFSENVAAHLRWEAFWPGNFYPDAAQTGQFGRIEIMAKF